MSKRARLAIAVGGVLAAAAASTILFFFFRDNFSTHFPIKAISAPIFRSGEIPYWNFYDGGGQPLAGNPNTLTFYPDNILYVFLPAQVAFNLHFLLHLLLAWFTMRALSRSPRAAWLYVLSGVALSATAFYNLIVGVALVPFAFYAAERRSPVALGLAFGLLALGTEPVTIVATAIGVVILLSVAPRPSAARLVIAALMALVIALPQLIAYSEIAGEVERARGYSAQTVLNASLEPIRLLEILIGPFLRSREPHLFLSLFIGLVVVPALLQRSRYVVLVVTMLFFALGRFNPLVSAAIGAMPAIRMARYPEKFAIPMMVAMAVLAARPLDSSRLWRWLTFVPLVAWAVVTVPIDLYAPYRVAPQPQERVFVARSAGGQELSRLEYRMRAQRLEPLFGAVAGLRYGVDRSPDGMFSLMTRIAAERYATTRNPRYLRIAGCRNAPGALPQAMIVPGIIGTRSVRQAVETIENPSFDEHASAVGPWRLDSFRSPADARVDRVIEEGQTLRILLRSPGPTMLLVNETYFQGWVARGATGELQTVPLDLDRLGVMIPAGTSTITLRFGRHRSAVLAAWVLSSLVLMLALFLLRVEIIDGRPRQVERSADENEAMR